MPTLNRQDILAALKTAMEPRPYVHAMWEGGAAAFNRVDEWSDIDLQFDVDDDRAPEAQAVVEETLSSLSPFTHRYEMPQPTWHGHYQTFYQFQNASPYLLLDLVIMKHSAPDKYIQPEVHGNPIVHFDKSGVIVAPPFNRVERAAKMAGRIAAMREQFPMFQTLTTKEIHRHNYLEAMAFYNAWTLRPLLEVLRIRYCPDRFDFFSRYVYYDLPKDVMAQVEPLYYVSNPDDLVVKQQKAEQLFNETIAYLDANPPTA